MRLINAADLSFKTDAELYAMIREASESLQGMDVYGLEYATTLSSLDIIKRALAARRVNEQKPLSPKF